VETGHSTRNDLGTKTKSIKGKKKELEAAKVEIHFDDGSSYNGLVDERNMFHGKGKHALVDSSYYHGDWVHGQQTVLGTQATTGKWRLL
jgi:hypothetical protein